MRFNWIGGTVVAIIWFGLAAASQAFPAINCVFNADQSAVNIVASYPPDSFGNEYTHKGDVTCQTSCLVKAAGEKKFTRFQCSFPLRVNAPQKIVCEQRGSGPGAFVDLRPKEVVCVLR